MKQKLLLFLFMLCTLNWVYAQERILEGTVTSGEDASPLPGVNVIIKGTTNGTITDIDGNFKLTAPSSATHILFSYVGFLAKEVEIGNSSNFSISLEEDSQVLSEVVVTALGIERSERSLGYAAQQVNGDDLVQAREANIVNSLAGKVAGVQITGASGTLGGSSRIVIRGVNSISGNNQPLFVVDGTPLDNSSYNSYGTQRGGGGTDFGNTISDLNPDDIESMSVLKGPSAAALYGSRASNGVILITTKSGKNRKGIGVSVNSGITFNNVYVLPEYQNEYGGGYKQSFDAFSYDPTRHPESWASFDGQPMVNYAADESWGPRMDGTPVREWFSWFPNDPNFGQLTPFDAQPDNVKNFYETGVTQNLNVSFEGGNDMGNFRLGMTHMNMTGTIPNSEQQRNTITFNGSSKLTERLTASVKATYVRTDTYGRPSTGYGGGQGNVVTSFNQWFQRQLDMDQLENYKTVDGLDRTWNIKGPDNLDPLYWENPYWVLYESPTEDYRERVFGNISLSYEVMEGLTLSAFGRTDFYTDRRELRIAEGSIPQSDYTESVRNVRENNYEFLAQYNKDFGKFSLSALGGANSRHEFYHLNTGSTVGGLSVPGLYNLTASVDRPSITDDYTEKVVNSIYGSTTLGYNDVFYLDLSLRNDWSSTLPTDNNSYLYPAATASMVFTELLPDNSVLSFGKIRAGWAQVGNDTDPYQLINAYESGDSYGNFPAYNVPDRLNNSELVPETTTSLEFGIDLRFFNGRAGLDFTYYDNTTTDQILPLSVSSTSGYSSAIINAGEMRNHGVELMLTATPIQLGNGFEWNVALNWARNQNEVIELADGMDNYQIASWGPSINARVGLPYGTWVTDGFEYHENGQRIVQPDGLFARATNQEYGSYLPDWTGGVTNNFSFKGVNVSALIDFQKGGDLYSVSNRYGTYSGMLAETVGNNDKGNPMRDAVADGGGIRADGVFEDGTSNNVYVDAQEYFKHLRSRREYFLYDASFVKFRELCIGYTLPKSLLGNLPFRQVNIAFVGRNLAILSKNVPNVDPESAYGSGNIQGFENGQHPSVRSLGFNLNFKL